MKWYVIPSIIVCALNCMLASMVLSLAVFHLYTDKSTNAPIRPNQEWIHRMTGLIPFSAGWLCVSLAGIFASMARNRKGFASLILVLDSMCFGVAIFFTLSFGALVGMDEVPAEELFNITLHQIPFGKSPLWIPDWLNNVQKQSKECCGIVTYHDYEEFWRETPMKLPRSCCREARDLPGPCPNDLTQIPYPHTPAIFYKVDTGCMDEINMNSHRHIQETFHNCIIMTIFIGMAVVAFALLLFKRYVANSPESERKLKLCEPCKCTEGRDGTKEPVQVNSEVDQGPAPAADSLEVVTPYNASAESVTQNQAQSVPKEKEREREREKERERERERERELNQHIPGVPKVNAAFIYGIPTIRQAQPEVVSTDDMTLGPVASDRRHEMYGVQDIPITDSSNGRMIPTISVDEIGDVIHTDDNQGTPPGSPGGKKKKHKKAGHHSHKHRHHHHNKDPAQN